MIRSRVSCLAGMYPSFHAPAPPGHPDVVSHQATSPCRGSGHGHGHGGASEGDRHPHVQRYVRRVVGDADAQRDVQAGVVVEPVRAPEHQRAQDDPHRTGHILPVLLGLTDDALVVAEADRGALVEGQPHARSEEHTSELQSLMRISYAVFCLKKKKRTSNTKTQDIYQVNTLINI